MEVCTPGSKHACYEGPASTKGIGICKAGEQTCAADGSGYGACVGQVLPAAAEDCTTPEDDNCDGTSNEASAGCVCAPGSTASCYDGPAGTEGVGLCHAGTKTCAADGKSYGTCAGEVLPQPETCATPGDDDCNGKTNEGGSGCACVPGSTSPCYSGPPTTENVGACHGGTQVCNAQGTGYGACTGEVVPQPETCNTPVDDDCNGMTNEGGAGCVCPPGQKVACYTGPTGTLNVGACKAGLAQCNDQGTVLGACVGQVLPQPETCNTPADDDCNGMTNESGAGCVCPPNEMVPCYTGPAGTLDVGACKGGLAQCNDQGTALGACVGQVLPQPETCNTPADDDCNGMTNEGGAGCVCLPNSTVSCYTGPAGTQGVGICKAGTKTCNAQGTAYGACTGEVLPAASEDCLNTLDDNCNGATNEGCAPTYAADAQPIFAKHCAPCHTTNGNGGANFATSYTDTQLASYYCTGKTKGACTIVRIQNGSMPPIVGCTGNPANDAAKPACLTAAEQATLQAWIAGGQKP